MLTSIQKLAALVTLSAATLTVAVPAFEPASPTSPASVARADEGSRAYLHSFNLPGHGVAIEGYSPVSYFSGRAERGSAVFAVEHDGISYHLASADQVSQFKANPEKFVPAFGGWCAFGMAVKDKFPVDPTNFKVVDDRLLLFLRNSGVDALELWNGKNESSLLSKAEAHWGKVQG